MRKQFKQFVLRWLVCSAGIWLSSVLFSGVEFDGRKLTVVVVGGLVLALINAVIKPIIMVLSLPAIMLSLGLFTIVVNGFMVVIASWVYRPLDVQSFGAAILTGILIGLLNFIITKLLENRGTKDE